MVDKSSNVTRLADRLIVRGLVIRGQNEQNRRIHELIVTPKGQKVFEKIREGLHKNMRSMIEERLQEEVLKKLIYLLVKMKGIV
jgi:DNA-binding MarR family transcriptional regulator